MQTLELKHLAPYLPYGLKIRNIDRAIESKYAIEELSCNDLRQSQIDIWNKYNCTKPILRPMSDLTKEIDHNGEKLSPEKILSHLDLEWLITSDNLIMKTNYEDVLKLLEWHFDVFGLIPSGLAIDINTLDQKP